MKRYLIAIALLLIGLMGWSAFGASPVLIAPKWDDPSEPANGNMWANGISPDGRYITLTSEASDLVPVDTNGQLDVFVYDRDAGAVEIVAPPTTDGSQPDGASFAGGISADGRYVGLSSYATNLIGGGPPGTCYPYV